MSEGAELRHRSKEKYSEVPSKELSPERAVERSKCYKCGILVIILLNITLWLGFGAYWISSSLSPPSVLQGVSSFVLEPVTIVTPIKYSKSWERHADQRIYVKDGIIVRIEDLSNPMDYTMVDTVYSLPNMVDRYVLPGLIDSHSHLPPSNPFHLSQYFSLLFLMHGVTTVREAGDTDGTTTKGLLSASYPHPRVSLDS